MSDVIFKVDKRLFASDRRRFVCFILDIVFALFSMFLFSFIIVIVGNVFNWDIFSIWREYLFNDMYTVLLLFLMFNYLVFEWLFARSPGKLITGSIVITNNGLKPGFGVVFIRTLCRLIPFDPISFLGKSGRVWHDSISDTYVVNKKDFDKAIEFHELNLIGIKETEEI